MMTNKHRNTTIRFLNKNQKTDTKKRLIESHKAQKQVNYQQNKY